MTNDTARHASKTPQVSVLMPVYNAEAYVAEAVESILGQTLVDFEFLIIDDGSTDGSAEIVASYAEKDPRISFRRQENCGVPVTRNEMAAAARAPFLAVMDADDIAMPDRFEKQVAFLTDNPDISVVGSLALVIDEAKRPIMVIKCPTESKEIDENNLVGIVSIMHPATMMRRDHFQDVGGYDEYFQNALDIDLWLRLAEKGRLANMPEVLLHYRMHSQSIGGSNIARQTEFVKEACRRAWARRGLPPREHAGFDIRPTSDPASQRDFAIRWGWQAWRSGYQGTARHYFLKAIRLDPLSVAAWKGLIFGTLRRSK